MKSLIVIPARGGSKGIPRKNLRPLCGKPLLYYSITNALSIDGENTIVVSSDDDEILSYAKSLNVLGYKRLESLSGDLVTLDAVVYDVWKSFSETNFDFIITLQPTSPTLSPYSINKGIRLASSDVDSVISARSIKHLFWVKHHDTLQPFHPSRLNRQELEPVYFETGGIVVTKTSFLADKKTRIGGSLAVLELDESESIDIDSDIDWALAQHVLSRKRIAFIVIGNEVQGMGHVYNCLELASEFVSHEICFFINESEKLAHSKINDNNYKYKIYGSTFELFDTLSKFKPDIIINDTLNTEPAYTLNLKNLTKKLVLIEDLGEGRSNADLVFNAMYALPELDNELSGHEYYCLRSDLMRSTPNHFSDKVQKVVLFFGGVDPGNCTRRVIERIWKHCCLLNIEVVVVVGAGNTYEPPFYMMDKLRVLRDVKDMASVLKGADLAFTSAGRSAFEVYAMRIPTIVICQNEKESTHAFVIEENGFINLGHHKDIQDQQIDLAFLKMLEVEPRKEAFMKMGRVDLRSGRQRIIRKILENI